MSSLIAKIEPSDSVHLAGVSEVEHLHGRHVGSMPVPRGLSVLVVDCGGAIDTLDIDRERARALYKREEKRIFSAVSLMRYGLRSGDLSAIAEAATASATLSQKILPKPIFSELLETALESGALGLNCAHSGTVLGVLYRSKDNLAGKLQPLIESRFGHSGRVLGEHRIISGGCHVS
jgi:L-threonine kinase